MYIFRMPSLGADMEAGALVEWEKHPGDPVKRGDIVAVVETDKGAIEVEIFVDGVMGKQLVETGAKVPVGTPLAEIEGAEEDAATAPPEATAPSAVPKAEPAPPSTQRRASPAARKLAAEKEISLDALKGTGPGGVIVLKDVEQAEGETAPRAGLDLSKMREAIAAAMARSKRDIPHYYLSTEIDMAAASDWLSKTNAPRTPDKRLLPAALTLKAAALAARKYPAMNGFYDPATGFAPSEDIHIGVAVAIRGGGLVSPAIHNCDKLGLDDLMDKLRDLAARAREGRLRSSELSDGTITVSSLGERGVESLYGIIYPPQVAIVGFGTVTQRPVAVDDKVAIRPIMTATLAADHRVSDGHLGARFLKHVNALLQEPEKL
ncbi:dihydrolipoamide acetyltransferase family protein [Hyphococcus luteus]|uniref:Dihydrolipoamide acetyltransferase component of pyruvate dehydrogenase complex n=1 Tax=Hyphococcus luteus TaxID=2058213 RepID=A0A2S7KA48_9PROT|nr:dihydrolipoamide acetyltransferase family protein [Marinicaulis flavus]PQA89394.1 2-oxo acid dehydrogenase subunit E2 [Marinicaulis flavus]